MTVGIPQRVINILPPQIDVVKNRASAWRDRGADVISLGQAVPGFPPPEIALTAAQRALRNPDTHVYSADAGLLALRAGLCQRLQEHYGITADPENEIIITAGANQAFVLALLTFLEPGDKVLLTSPYFMNHEMGVRAVGGLPVEVPLDESTGFALHWKDLAPYINDRTRAVVIVSPNNPTGAVYQPEDLIEIERELISRGIWLISDETYLHFVYENARHFSLASIPGWQEGVLMLGSFSKSFAMTGWRVGYLIASREFITQALKIQDTMIICAPVIAQEAVLAAVEQEWDYPHRFIDELNSRRLYLHQRLQKIPHLHWHPTLGGFFAFVKVAGCSDAQQLAFEILDQVHVVTIPGNLFGRTGQGFLRLSYGSVHKSDLEKALDRLEKYFHENYQPDR